MAETCLTINRYLRRYLLSEIILVWVGNCTYFFFRIYFWSLKVNEKNEKKWYFAR